MGLVEFRLALGWKVVHDMMLPALFLDRPKLELQESYKSLSLFCRGTNSGNPDDERPTGILVWHRSQVRLWFARTGTLTLYRSPYTVHTRKSLSSTALSQSDNGVQYVDCNPGRGGCPREGAHRWVYGLFVLHSSDAV